MLSELMLPHVDKELSGVGGQHQNRRAERTICTVFSLARALLIHSALYWPEAHDLELWPFAVDYAVWILNNLPSHDGLSPLEKFSRQKFNNYNHLRRAHVWGAPMYVLDPKLQDGHKLPKFNPRSRQGKFVGFSPHHSSNVALVLNRRTGSISPQYHVVFDDYFHTVRGATQANEIDLEAFDWDSFITPANSERFLDDADRVLQPVLAPEWDPVDPVEGPAVRPPPLQAIAAAPAAPRLHRRAINLPRDPDNLQIQSSSDESSDSIRVKLEHDAPAVHGTPPTASVGAPATSPECAPPPAPVGVVT
jgi:hypothetical protein